LLDLLCFVLSGDKECDFDLLLWDLFLPVIIEMICDQHKTCKKKVTIFKRHCGSCLLILTLYCSTD
jgi:hypothetical protein